VLAGGLYTLAELLAFGVEVILPAPVGLVVRF
jgi:hypothetical protein